LESGGLIAFDSRSGVSPLIQVLFWANYGVLLVDWLRGDESCMSIRIRPFRVWLSYGDGIKMFDLEWCFLGQVVAMSGYGYCF